MSAGARLPRLPDWPSMMGRETAAAYCEVSVTHFEFHCPVRPVRLGTRLLWRRKDLDQWQESLPSVEPPRYQGRKAPANVDTPPASNDHPQPGGKGQVRSWLDRVNARARKGHQ